MSGRFFVGGRFSVSIFWHNLLRVWQILCDRFVCGRFFAYFSIQMFGSDGGYFCRFCTDVGNDIWEFEWLGRSLEFVCGIIVFWCDHFFCGAIVRLDVWLKFDLFSISLN